MKIRLSILTLILFSLLSFHCENKEKVLKTVSEPKDTVVQKQYIKSDSTQTQKTKTKVLVVQCSNGYGYSGLGYDFNPIIENELKKNANFEVLPFPYKKLQGISYQGVYDKKYAKPIIEKVDAEIFIMTKFEGDQIEIEENEKKVWGYEVKILNTKTMEQKVSISAKQLSTYKELESDIISKVNILARDIDNFK